MGSTQSSDKTWKSAEICQMMSSVRVKLFVWDALLAPMSCVSTDSLVSRHTADILIGPELPGGTGRWLLCGWTGERVDRHQWVLKHWLATFGPPEEHLTACDCVCWAFSSGESRSNHRSADITSPVLFAETARRSWFIQRRRKYWTLKLFSSMLMKRRCNNIYTAHTFQHTSAGWITWF